MSISASTSALPANADSMDDDASAPAGQTIESFLADVERRAYRFALYELRDRDAALDAVQDSMWRLVERYADRPSTEWPALFFTILRNRATDARRWRIAQQLRGLLRWNGGADDEDYAWLEIAAPDRETPEAERVAAEQRMALERALAQLPSRQCEVFLLREWQGLTTSETAQALGCTEGTVKQHHFRALQSLRARLSGVWHE